MTSPWKAFAAEVAALLVIGAACTFIAGTWFEHKDVQPDAVNVMRLAMFVGVAAAAVLLSVIAALKFWRLKPLMWAVGVMSIVFTGHPGKAVVVLAASAIVYWTLTKVRILLGFYLPASDTKSDG